MKRFDSSGLFLHASAVIVDGGAVLFLGHSTAGKSTIARLLGAVCPVLADDTVFAWRTEQGEWRVADGKFRFDSCPLPARRSAQREGGTPVPRPSFPLRSCVRIHKGLALRHELLPPAETAGCLMDAVMEVDAQRTCGRLNPKQPASAKAAIAEVRTMRRTWFHLVADIARACPGQRLWFPRDADPRKVVKVISGDVDNQIETRILRRICGWRE